MTHYGVDLSSNNPHPIDYARATGHLRQLGGGDQPFAIVKAAEGTGYVNPYAGADIYGFRAAGAAVAVYTFLDPGASPGAEVALADAHAEGARVMVDWETGEPASDALAAIDAAGPTSLLYGSASYLNQVPGLAVSRRWLADPSHPVGTPSMPCVMHQYSWTGVIAGIGRGCDLNVFYGDENAFAAVFGLAPPAPLVVPPTQDFPMIGELGVQKHLVNIPTGADGSGWTPTPLPYPFGTVVCATINPADRVAGQPPTSGTAKVADRGAAGTYLEIEGCPANSVIGVWVVTTQ